MSDDLQDLAQLDALLSNWDMILTKMGPASAAREQELAKIAARLSAANSPGEIARALDDFLDLVQDTPACGLRSSVNCPFANSRRKSER